MPDDLPIVESPPTPPTTAPQELRSSPPQDPNSSAKPSAKPSGTDNTQASKALGATVSALKDIGKNFAAATTAQGHQESGLDAIYGVQHMNIPGGNSTIGAVPSAMPALAPMNAQAPALLPVPQINAPSLAPISNISSQTVSDQRAKTNIQSGKRDIYAFLNALKTQVIK